METPDNKLPNSLIWIAGLAIILFCVIGIAAIMGWIPTSMNRGDNDAPLSSTERSRTPSSVPAKLKQHMESESRPAPAPAANDVNH